VNCLVAKFATAVIYYFGFAGHDELVKMFCSSAVLQFCG
jgi:hypothetical protein